MSVKIRWIFLLLMPIIIQAVEPVVVLGSGVAALTSAVYLARGGVPPLVITGARLGGAITQSHSVQNWPGELDISGGELSERILEQARQNGAVFETAEVIEADFSVRPFKITVKPLLEEKTKVIHAYACIIALGSTPNQLQVPGEAEYQLKGVYSCAVCDGNLYQDRIVGVVGGGDGALTEAHYLSRIAKKVYVLMRKEQFRSIEPERARELERLSNVEIIRGVEVVEIQGDGAALNAVVTRNIKDHKIQTWEMDALFLAIGATPNTQLFQGQLQLDERGYIVTRQQETSIAGVYAVGDITPGVKQAIAAAGDAAKAALSVVDYLSKKPARNVVIEIRSTHELKELMTHGQVILDFYGDYCPPCRTFAPIYAKFAEQWGEHLIFAKVNATVVPELFREYQIQAIPTVILFDQEGKVASRGTGALEIQRLLEIAVKAIEPAS